MGHIKEHEIVKKQRHWLAQHPNGPVLRLMTARNVTSPILVRDDMGGMDLTKSARKAGWKLLCECTKDEVPLFDDPQERAAMQQKVEDLRLGARAKAKVDTVEAKAREAAREKEIERLVEERAQKLLAEREAAKAAAPAEAEPEAEADGFDATKPRVRKGARA